MLLEGRSIVGTGGDDKVLAVNVKSVFFASLAAARQFVRRGPAA